MNKQELDNLTKHESTWEEFDRVEAIYMADGRMTKDEAAKVWKALYGEAAKARENAEPTADEICDKIATGYGIHYTHDDGYEARITIRGRFFIFTTDGRRYFWQGREVVRVDVARGERVLGAKVYNLLYDDRRMHITTAA